MLRSSLRSLFKNKFHAALTLLLSAGCAGYLFLGRLRRQNLYETINAVPGGLPRACGERAGAPVIVDTLPALVFWGYLCARKGSRMN